MQQIQINSDKLTKKNIINRITDVPGGVSLTLADLVIGQVVEEATPLTAPSSGKRTVCKQAKLLTGSSVTVFVVDSELHNFKVGEYLMQAVGGAAYAITDITDNGDGTSDITVGTALEAATAGVFIYKSSATGATAGALNDVAEVILKNAFEVPSAAQVIWIKDAHVRADIYADVIGPLYLTQMAGAIREINY